MYGNPFEAGAFAGEDAPLLGADAALQAAVRARNPEMLQVGAAPAVRGAFFSPCRSLSLSDALCILSLSLPL